MTDAEQIKKIQAATQAERERLHSLGIAPPQRPRAPVRAPKKFNPNGSNITQPIIQKTKGGFFK